MVTPRMALTAKNTGEQGGLPKGDQSQAKEKGKKIEGTKIKEPKVKFAKESKEDKFTSNCYYSKKSWAPR